MIIIEDIPTPKSEDSCCCSQHVSPSMYSYLKLLLFTKNKIPISTCSCSIIVSCFYLFQNFVSF